MKSRAGQAGFVAVVTCWNVCAAFCGQFSIFPGDGSDEPGFVPPPVDWTPPPPPPKQVSSAETFIPFPGPPVVPMARSEAKKPPRPLTLFTKLRTDKPLLDWCATPNDVNNMLKKMKNLINVDYSVEVKAMKEVVAEPDRNPILFRSGHYHFEWSPEERAMLRKYLLNGGMLILNTGLGSKPFYESAVKEMNRLFPEVHLQKLSPDHPIFHSYYDVDRVKYRPGVYASGRFKGNEPWFEGLTIDCRLVALLSRWCMAVGWEENEDDTFQAYESESAQRLGVNIFAYATAQRAWVKNAAHMMKFTDSGSYSGDKVSIAQVIYDGEWKTRHVGLQLLLQQFNVKTDIPVKFAVSEVRLTDPKLFDIPLLYMTGHEDFLLKPEEMTALGNYLRNGGFLFAEACCGRKGFDQAFRAHLKKMLPENALKEIPAESMLFSLPNKVRQTGVTPALAAQLGNKSAAEPVLLGVDVDGHWAVIYSPFGMAGGWELSPNPYALGYDNVGSFQLAQNILMYAITQ